MPEITLSELETLAYRYLVSAGCSQDAAAPVARSLVQAEAEGNTVCGLFYLPVFKEQLALKKINGQAHPKLLKNEGNSITVDADNGFAHPAIELAIPKLIAATRNNGVAAAGITRSYNALSLAHHVLPLAREGLIGLCCSNAPASVAPPGCTKPIFGTNPIAFAVPGKDGNPALVIDQSTSEVTKTKLLLHSQRQLEIPLGWAQDKQGHPTTDPDTGLAGTMLPFGGQKGANIGLIVEILSAALTGANLSMFAASFSGQDKGHPGVGQFLLAIDPEKFAADAFRQSLETLIINFEQGGVRLPGKKFRDAKKPDDSTLVSVDDELWNELKSCTI